MLDNQYYQKLEQLDLKLNLINDKFNDIKRKKHKNAIYK